MKAMTTGMIRAAGWAAAVVLLATGCGGSGENETEPAAKETTDSPSLTSSPTTQPTPVESEQCRQDAGEVIDILELALQDQDVRDLAGRLDTVDDLLPEAVAQCTGAVSRPVSEAQVALSASFDAAVNGSKGGSKAYAEAYEKVMAARTALDATT